MKTKTFLKIVGIMAILLITAACSDKNKESDSANVSVPVPAKQPNIERKEVVVNVNNKEKLDVCSLISNQDLMKECGYSDDQFFTQNYKSGSCGFYKIGAQASLSEVVAVNYSEGLDLFNQGKESAALWKSEVVNDMGDETLLVQVAGMDTLFTKKGGKSLQVVGPFKRCNIKNLGRLAVDRIPPKPDQRQGVENILSNSKVPQNVCLRLHDKDNSFYYCEDESGNKHTVTKNEKNKAIEETYCVNGKFIICTGGNNVKYYNTVEYNQPPSCSVVAACPAKYPVPGFTGFNFNNNDTVDPRGFNVAERYMTGRRLPMQCFVKDDIKICYYYGYKLPLSFTSSANSISADEETRVRWIALPSAIEQAIQ